MNAGTEVGPELWRGPDGRAIFACGDEFCFQLFLRLLPEGAKELADKIGRILKPAGRSLGIQEFTRSIGQCHIDRPHASNFHCILLRDDKRGQLVRGWIPLGGLADDKLKDTGFRERRAPGVHPRCVSDRLP